MHQDRSEPDEHGWGEVERQLVAFGTGSEPIPSSIVRKTRDLLTFARTCREPPKDIGSGYWRTICLSWDDIDVEVTETAFELYWFTAAGTSIEEYGHRPDGILSSELIAAFTPRRGEVALGDPD